MHGDTDNGKDTGKTLLQVDIRIMQLHTLIYIYSWLDDEGLYGENSSSMVDPLCCQALTPWTRP